MKRLRGSVASIEGDHAPCAAALPIDARDTPAVRADLTSIERPAKLQRLSDGHGQRRYAIRGEEHSRTDAVGARAPLVVEAVKELRLATFNARVETVTTKPFFKEAFKRTRCIIPASGYYEWQDAPAGKQPYYFTRADGQVISFAGLWDE
jgi:putative SOS response-associated peptidase YedK